jgi:paraquat-inducible protein A
MGFAMESESPSVRACPKCGLAQWVPPTPPGMRAGCARCGGAMRRRAFGRRSANRTAAIAMAALILYPLAVSLPMIEVQQLGHRHQSSILEGITSLFAHGQFVLGLIVLLCSVVFPVGKLIALVVLTVGGLGMAEHHKALTYRLVEWTGRWGVLDVLLVAVLVAAMKLGDWMEVTPGPAALAFASCVVLSLLAAATFDPHSLWEEGR